jgi:hypothetical protein
LGLLIASLFFERFFFITTVYKTKYYGYVLILMVIGLNCVFTMLMSRAGEQKQTKKLHQLFEIERAPDVNNCVIGLVGMLDMLYAFFLFWPANVIPVWMLLVLLQLFIPLNMLVRRGCLGLSHFKVHSMSALIILAAIGIAMLNFTTAGYQTGGLMVYTVLFLVCAVFDAMSHALKESIVRSQPLDQPLFSFRVSLS